MAGTKKLINFNVLKLREREASASSLQASQRVFRRYF